MLRCYYCQFFIEAAPMGAMANDSARVLVTRKCLKPAKNREISPDSQVCEVFQRGSYFFCDIYGQRMAYEACCSRREKPAGINLECPKCQQWPFVEEACIENPLQKRERKLTVRDKKKTVQIEPIVIEQARETVQVISPAIRLKQKATVMQKKSLNLRRQ